MIGSRVLAAAENVYRLIIEPHGPRRGSDAARSSGTFEQRLAERPLQALQSCRNRRLRDMQPISRLTHAAFLEYGDENSELLQLEAHIRPLISNDLNIDIIYNNDDPDYIILCWRSNYFHTETAARRAPQSFPSQIEIAMNYQNILTETVGNVGLIRFNRPQVRNALSRATIAELSRAVKAFEDDPRIGALVLTGDDKAFAAGADIGEMAKFKSFAEVFAIEFSGAEWLEISRCRKPVIAAVAGYALGGGCELAMMCDFILAAPNAKFGQLEITVGVTPGTGGTQRLTRAVGKSKAMEMCLTGRMMDADEAERSGLVSRIVEAPQLVDEAIKTAARAASMSRPVSMMIKECVNRAYETPLAEGLLMERRAFHACFSLEDQKEGMTAFVEKRRPKFENR
jgi:enoyl-CoA hydratase